MPDYAFLTSDNFRVEASGRNPKAAYKVAIKKHKEIMDKMKKLPPENKKGLDPNAKVLPAYVTYRNGFADYNWRSLK